MDDTDLVLKTDNSRFLESGGLTNSDILKKKQTLDEVWEKYWKTLFDDKYRPLLKKEILDHPIYSIIWKRATIIFTQKKATGIAFQDTVANKFGKKFNADDFHIACVAYALNNVPGAGGVRLFEDFNKASRDLTVITFPDFKFKSLWYLLGFSVPQLENQFLEETTTLYRGLHNVHYSNRNLKQAIKDGTPVVLGTAFVSTALKKSCALDFAGNLGCPNCDHKKCLITFNGKPNYGNSINDHSLYDEKEVLLCPWSQWVVTNVSYEGKWQLVEVEPNRDQPLHKQTK